MQASDDISHVFDKYKTVIVDGIPVIDKAANHSLLDLDGIDLQVNTDLSEAAASENKEIDVLCDVFSSTDIPEQPSSTNDFLLPMIANKQEEIENKTEKIVENKSKALEELNVLSENLLKENLQASKKVEQCNKWVFLKKFSSIKFI